MPLHDMLWLLMVVFVTSEWVKLSRAAWRNYCSDAAAAGASWRRLRCRMRLMLSVLWLLIPVAYYSSVHTDIFVPINADQIVALKVEAHPRKTTLPSAHWCTGVPCDHPL